MAQLCYYTGISAWSWNEVPKTGLQPVPNLYIFFPQTFTTYRETQNPQWLVIN